MSRTPFHTSGKEILGLSKIANNENIKDGDLGDVEDKVIAGISTKSRHNDYKQDFERELARISNNIGINLSVSKPAKTFTSQPAKTFTSQPAKTFDLSKPKPSTNKPVFSMSSGANISSSDSDDGSVSSRSTTSTLSSRSTRSSKSSRSAQSRHHANDRMRRRSPPPKQYREYTHAHASAPDSGDDSDGSEDDHAEINDSSNNRRREQLRSFLNEGYKNFSIGERHEVEQLDVLEMASEIDQIRYNLIDIGVDKASLPAVDMERMTHSEIQRILFFYRRMDDQYKYKSLPEELILGAAGFAEQIFDGKTEILGKWRPNYTGLQNNMQSRLTRVSPYMGRVVSEVSRKHGIDDFSIISLQLCLPLITLPISNARKITKPTRNQLTMSALNELENA